MRHPYEVETDLVTEVKIFVLLLSKICRSDSIALLVNEVADRIEKIELGMMDKGLPLSNFIPEIKIFFHVNCVGRVVFILRNNDKVKYRISQKLISVESFLSKMLRTA